MKPLQSALATAACMSEETCTVNLKPLSPKGEDSFKLQSWKREDLDLVNNWFICCTL